MAGCHHSLLWPEILVSQEKSGRTYQPDTYRDDNMVTILLTKHSISLKKRNYCLLQNDIYINY